MEKEFTQSFYKKTQKILNEVEKVILGKRDVVKLLLLSLLSGGHVLIEDVPGVGKTTLAIALGKATGLDCRRAQFTPDVMASDITGFTIFNKEKNDFEYKEGFVMCNILLADEINRTSPKTQSALLEAMEEHNVTVDNTTYKLPEPFMVVATQNETGFIGTFPLPEAQLDRFLIKVSIGYPTLQEEMEVISSRQTANPIDMVEPICTREEIIKGIETIREINIEQSVYQYIVELVAATRQHSMVELGASPRASIMLMRASQSHAFLSGRLFVTPEDVSAMLIPVLSHRIKLTQEAKIKRIKREDLLTEISRRINPPHKR